MKMMKWALLGGAALAVTATAARADDLADLKAQVEALQHRVAELEAQPQSSMPSGYSLLSIRDGQGMYEGTLPERYADTPRDDSGFTLSVLPTADVAPVAEVSVSGEIRTALIYSDYSSQDNSDDLDLNVRGRIFIRGKTETAVGEVGGYFRLQADGGGNFNDYSENTRMNKAYGWWKFAPAWELMAGYNDNTGALQVGWDWMAATGPVASFGPSNINNEQMRLTYASGPLSFAISVEDPDNTATSTSFSGIAVDGDGDGVIDPVGNPLDWSTVTVRSLSDKSDLPAVEGYIMYSSDVFTGQIAGLYQNDDYGSDDWAIGGGANIGIADSFTFTIGGVIGEGTSQYANNLGPLTTDDDFWAASAGVIFNIAEDTRIEAGVGYEDYDLAGNALGFGGGVYWDPVSQLTLGVGATYVEYSDINSLTTVDDDGVAGFPTTPVVEIASEDDSDQLQVFFGTWFRFP